MPMLIICHIYCCLMLADLFIADAAFADAAADMAFRHGPPLCLGWAAASALYASDCCHDAAMLMIAAIYCHFLLR